MPSPDQPGDPVGEQPGDRLLYAASAWGTASREQLRQACDRLSPPAGDGADPAAARRNRAAALRALVALGHGEPEPGGGLSVLPPHLTELPAAGAPQALLCGARTPALAAAADAAARRCGARLHRTAQPSPLSPARLLMTAPTRAALRQAAGQLQAAYQGAPAAWQALGRDRSTVQTVQQALQWARTPELDWPRRDFDTTTCTFKAPADAEPGPRRLSSYLDPVTQQARHLLWKGDQWAPADPAWGRWLSLQHRQRTVATYLWQERSLICPSTAPLPPALSRALTQCSGLLPATHRVVPASHRLGGEVASWDVYRQVPPDVGEEVLRRLQAH